MLGSGGTWNGVPRADGVALSETRTFTHAELFGLDSVDIELLAAPAAGLAHDVLEVVSSSQFVTTPYIGTGITLSLLEGTEVQASLDASFLNPSSNSMVISEGAQGRKPQGGAALVIRASAAITEAGTADSIVKIRVYYRVVKFPLSVEAADPSWGPFVKSDGSTPLTAPWDAGAQSISGFGRLDIVGVIADPTPALNVTPTPGGGGPAINVTTAFGMTAVLAIDGVDCILPDASSIFSTVGAQNVQTNTLQESVRHTAVSGAISIDDTIIAVDPTSGPKVYPLPDTVTARTAQKFVVLDETGQASAIRTITINADAGPGDTIKGAGSYVISQPYGWKSVV